MESTHVSQNSSQAVCRQMTWYGHPAITLENEALRVVVLPGHGGKIVSLWCKSAEAELMLPPLTPYKIPSHVSGFMDADRGGFDECLPSVSPVSGMDEGSVPDHGDLWRLPWPTEVQGDSLRQTVEGFSRSLRLSRRLWLRRGSLLLEYSLENIGAREQHYVYSAHPLFAVEAGDRIVLPSEINCVRVSGSTPQGLLETGSLISWPFFRSTGAGEQEIDLSEVGPEDGETSRKLFTGPVKAGWCALYRASLRLGVILTFDPRELTHVGVWASFGAWPLTGARQYTVALEPTTSPFDSLLQAKAESSAVLLPAGGIRKWTIRICIVHPATIQDLHGFSC